MRHAGTRSPDQAGRPDPIAVRERGIQEHHVRLGALCLGDGLESISRLPDNVQIGLPLQDGHDGLSEQGLLIR